MERLINLSYINMVLRRPKTFFFRSIIFRKNWYLVFVTKLWKHRMLMKLNHLMTSSFIIFTSYAEIKFFSWRLLKRLQIIFLLLDIDILGAFFLSPFDSVNNPVLSNNVRCSLLLHEVRYVFFSVGSGRQDFDADVGDNHRLLELCRQLSVGRHRCPVVRPSLIRPNTWKSLTLLNLKTNFLRSKLH